MFVELSDCDLIKNLTEHAPRMSLLRLILIGTIQKSELKTKKQDRTIKESELKTNRHNRPIQKSELGINRLYRPIQSEDRIGIGRSINRTFRPPLLESALEAVRVSVEAVRVHSHGLN